MRHTAPPAASVPSSQIDSATETVVIPLQLCNLPPLNTIVNQVLTLSVDPELDIGHLSSIMRRDPAFASDVLLLANSALFGFPRKMHSLRHAIAILGVDRIRALAATVALRSFVGSASPLVRQCWQHSVACALVCERIGPIFAVTSEIAYTLGLMHDVGLLGLLSSYPREIEGLLTDTFEGTEQVLVAERALLKVDHTRAGSWLTKSWSLPSTFAECCEQHHDPFSPEDADLLKVVKLGCKMADALNYVAFKYKNVLGYNQIVQSLELELRSDSFPTEAVLRAIVDERLAIFL